MKKPKAQIEYRATADLLSLEGNPRIVMDDDLRRLMRSIKENPPSYFEARAIILSNRTGELVVIAGNQRLKAAQKLKMRSVPTILLEGLTLEEEQRIIITDNVSTGSWDNELLNTSAWDRDSLEEWGVDTSSWDEPEERAGADHLKELQKWVPDCLFPSNNVYDIPTLLPELQADTLHNPFKPYGALKRSSTGVGTYHFYVDDYRFQAIWENPNTIIQSDAKAIVEPNLSLYNETPRSYGLHLIYKKRWMARYLQSFGVRIFVDLNVADKFREDNTLGIPEGWNAFATRGSGDYPQAFLQDLAIAQRISGKDQPYMIVYGGGKKVREMAAKHNLIFIDQISAENTKKEAI